MASLLNPFSWFGSQTPTRVAGDRVLPVHDIDNREATRTVLCWTLKFGEVLDADRLHRAFVELLGIGEWSKLGGRLRKNEKGQLQLHVPEKFTPERPGVLFSHVEISTTIAEHPLASKLPTATKTASIHPGAPDFLSLTAPKDASRTVDDHLARDDPQFTIQVTTFLDGTLLTLVWPHTLTDCMGMKSVLTSWALVLAGRSSEVPPLLGVDRHPLSEIGLDDGPHEEPLPARLQGWPMVGFIIRYFYERWLEPDLETRTLYMPSTILTTLKRSILTSLTTSASTPLVLDQTTGGPFLSDGDILTSWLARASYRSLVPASSTQRTLAVMNLFDSRGRAPGAFDPGAAYLVNASFATFANIPPSQARSLPDIASSVRGALVAQTTPGQVHMAVRELRGSLTSLLPLLFWPADSVMFVMSNWARAKFFESIDFGPAVVPGNGKEDEGGDRRYSYGPGRPVFAHAHLVVPETAARQSFQVMGRDASGGYWMHGNLPASAWKGMEKEVAILNGEETDSS